MNHSLFVELYHSGVDVEDVYKLIKNGKVVNIYRGLGLYGDRDVISVKGNGWRAYIEIRYGDSWFSDVIKEEDVEESKYIDIPRTCSIQEYNCYSNIGKIEIRCKYVVHSVLLIAVIDINEYNKTDKVVKELIAKYFKAVRLTALIRPM